MVFLGYSMYILIYKAGVIVIFLIVSGCTATSKHYSISDSLEVDNQCMYKVDEKESAQPSLILYLII